MIPCISFRHLQYFVAVYEEGSFTKQIFGTVRAGVIPSLVRGILPSFLPEFVEKHPAIELRLAESFSGTLTDWLLAQEIDLAFVVEPPRHEGLEMEKIAEGPAVLISGKAVGLSPGA